MKVKRYWSLTQWLTYCLGGAALAIAIFAFLLMGYSIIVGIGG